jgi:hypothetical protein
MTSPTEPAIGASPAEAEPGTPPDAPPDALVVRQRHLVGRPTPRTKAPNAGRTVVPAAPVGAAMLAKQEGQGYFELQLPAGASQRDPDSPADDGRTTGHAPRHAGTLAAIEAVGWRLEHVSYVYVPATSAQASGDGRADAAAPGQVVGVYLFRNSDPPGPATRNPAPLA